MLLEEVCAKIIDGWREMSYALQKLLLSAFQEVNNLNHMHSAYVVGENVIMDKMFVVADGTFFSTSSQVNDGDLVLKEYTRGMAICEAALYEESARSRVTVKCSSYDGQLFALKGSVYRKIRRREHTLNEHMSTDEFLRLTGYYDDDNIVMRASALYKVCSTHCGRHAARAPRVNRGILVRLRR